MRLMYYKNKDTKETTTSYEIAKKWKNKTVLFKEVEPPIGSEETKENEKAKEANKGKKISPKLTKRY